MSQAPCIVGVRHHSPACARLVRRRILQERPACVLIEGPSHFNPDRHQLLLDHQLPIAVFSSHQGVESRSYSPFCDYSPEWVALRTAHEIGSDFLFIDNLGVQGCEPEPPSTFSPNLLARRLGYDNNDALWDAMVEQAPEENLEHNLAEYFRLLRLQVGERDRQREEFMAQAVAWAWHQGSCLVVCGGFHAPYLEANWRNFPPQWPVPEMAPGRAFLVPFSFERLSSLTGYQAGMTCPEYYQRLWESDWEEAGRYCLQAAGEALRRRQQPVSTADLIAATSQAEALRRLRGHRYPLRCDLLDALLSSLCKEALEEVPPWSSQGPVGAGNHPPLVALLSAFTGCRRGQLCPSTPRPPLVLEVEEGFRHHQLTPTHPPRQLLTIPDTDPSRFLWRLKILELPGIQCLAEEPETWSLGRHEDFDAFLLEASAYGADLQTASVAALESGSIHWEGAAGIAAGLQMAARAGLDELSSRLLLPLAGLLSRELRLEELAPALESLALTLKVFPRLDPSLSLLRVGQDRLLWLLEGQLGSPERAVEAIRVSRELMRHPDLPSQAGLEVMARLTRQSRPAVRGAALGLIWSLRGQPPELLEAVHGVAELGDFLWGLFRLAREEVLGQIPLLRAIHDQLIALDGQEFLRQLPGLRQAFLEFPPRQKEQLALQLAQWLGLSNARQLTQGPFDSATMQRAVLLDRAVHEEMQRLGW